MKGQNTANVLLILMAVLTVLGIILITTIGRLSYAFFGAGAVLGIVSWIIKRRRR